MKVLPNEGQSLNAKCIAAVGVGLALVAGCSPSISEQADSLEAAIPSVSATTSAAESDAHTSRFASGLVVPDYFDLYTDDDDSETWVTSDRNNERYPKVLRDVAAMLTTVAGKNWGDATWCGYENGYPDFSLTPPDPPDMPDGYSWRMPEGSKDGPVFQVEVHKVIDKIYLEIGFSNGYMTACTASHVEP